jgi:hypothetical protein
VGNNQLPDDDPVRFLQKYFGNKDAVGGGSNKKSGGGVKVHPNYIMNKLDKQFKKDLSSMDDYLNNSSPMGGVAAYNYINMNSDT